MNPELNIGNTSLWVESWHRRDIKRLLQSLSLSSALPFTSHCQSSVHYWGTMTLVLFPLSYLPSPHTKPECVKLHCVSLWPGLGVPQRLKSLVDWGIHYRKVLGKGNDLSRRYKLGGSQLRWMTEFERRSRKGSLLIRHLNWDLSRDGTAPQDTG